MIPKTIHYVWVGTQPKPALLYRCLDSWRRHLPDYALVEWDNEACERIHTRYSREAFDNRKWAFVSDYVRLHALFQEGGLYLDTDVEVTANLDRFLDHDFFTGFEDYNGASAPVTAVMGAAPGNRIIGDLLAYYRDAPFEVADGVDLQPNTTRIADYFATRHGLRPPYAPSRTHYLDGCSVIYPASHFCTPVPCVENFAIHHFNGSWLEGFSRRTKLRLPGGYSIVRLRRNPEVRSAALPIYQHERLVWTLAAPNGKMFAVIKRSNGPKRGI